MDWPIDVFAVAIIAVAVAISAHFSNETHRRARRRTKNMRKLARYWGFDFKVTDHRFPRALEPGFPTLALGQNRFAQNFMRGKRDGPNIAVFDHHYQQRTSKNTTVHTYRTFVALEISFNAGIIELRPEHAGDRVASAFGFNDIDFESVEFSERYHVSSRDRKRAYEMLHPVMIECLLDAPDMLLTTYGTNVVACHPNQDPLSIPDIIAMVEALTRVAAHMPRTLNSERGAS